MGYVYCITNTVNQKQYIGITVRDPKKRIIEHFSGNGSSLIVRDLKKYGRAAFIYKILESNVLPELLPDLEAFYIEEFNSLSPHGYNLTYSGSYAITSEESRRKLSEALKGRSPWNKGKKGLQVAWNKGKPHTPETLRKISEAVKGENHPNFGKSHTLETRRKMSETRTSPHYASAKRYWDSLPVDMPLKDKRKLFHQTVKSVSIASRNKWIRRWLNG